MEIIKLFFEIFEQELFSFIGAVSWLDFAECMVGYTFVSFFVIIAFVIPIAFFLLLFFSPFL